jgi:hypothetical protein
LRRINRDVQVHPPAPAARLYKAPSSSPSGHQFTNNRYSYLGDLSLLPLLAAFFCISIACTARTVPARAEPPEPHLAAEILLGIGDYFLYVNDKRVNDYFTYSGSALRSPACIDCVRLHRLRSLTMGDNGNSGDAVTQTSTGYFLNQMFMFISCTRYMPVRCYGHQNVYNANKKYTVKFV